MFQSGYEIAISPGGQLQISSTPSYVLCIATALIGIVPSYVFVRTMVRTKTMFPLWGFVVWTLPWVLISLVWLRTGGLTLDKAADTANLRNYIALVLEDGAALTFADSDQEGGKGQAVERINRYMATVVR